MITEDYVSFETAKLLKEKGFSSDEISCIKVFKGHTYKVQGTTIDADEDVTIPTIQLSMKWLREVHHIFIDIISRFSKNADNDVCFSYSCKKLTDKYEIVDGEWLCYEEACEAAIKYCLENLI